MAATGFADLKDLVARVCGNDVRKVLEDADFRRLEVGGYTTQLRLESASADSLRASGLNPAVVDVLVSRTSGQKRRLESLDEDRSPKRSRAEHRDLVDKVMSSPSATDVHRLHRIQNSMEPAMKNFQWPGTQPPIGLFTPILGAFRQQCRKRVISEDDAECATALAGIGREYFKKATGTDTKTYAQCVDDVLVPYFARPHNSVQLPAWGPVRSLYSGGEQSDAGITGPENCPILLVEYRRLPEATAVEQCIRNHDRALNTLISAGRPIAMSCYAPALILTLQGSHLRVGGVVRGSVEIFEPFEQADMLPMWMQQPDSMEHLARVLGQIFVTCHELYAFYQDSGINPRMSMRRQYFDNDIPEALQGARFSQVKLYDPARRGNLWTYYDETGKLHCMAKAVQSKQALEVHRLWTNHGLAPRLCPGTSAESTGGGWWVMCMERLTATAKWMRPNEVPKGDAAGAKAAALAAMTRGHSLFLPSGRQTVHGDARSPNILMRRAEAKDEWDVRFLDFDWAGEVEHAFYPRPLDKEKYWPASAGYKRPITQAHDLEQVANAFTEP